MCVYIFNGQWQEKYLIVQRVVHIFFLSSPFFLSPVETKLCPLTCACSVPSPALDCHLLCMFRNAQLP